MLIARQGSVPKELTDISALESCVSPAGRSVLFHSGKPGPILRLGSAGLFTLRPHPITYAPHDYQHHIAKNKKCPSVIGQESKCHEICLPDAQFQLRLQLVHKVPLHRIGGHAVFDGLIGVNDCAMIAAAEMKPDRLER